MDRTKLSDRIKDRLALLEAVLIIALITALLAFDPFKIIFNIISFLRFRFLIFTKEPRLLFYTYAYIGSILAKTIAIFFIIVLALAHRLSLNENLGVKMPVSRNWRDYVIPFALIAAILRLYYSWNPLVPNLPVRLVFPEASAYGTILITFSIIFIAPLTEEVIFRGYFFDVFKRNFGQTASVVITSVLFAAAHAPQMEFDLTGVGTIFLIGLFLGFLRKKFDSVLIPVLFHGLYNSVYIVVGTLNYLIVGY